MWQKLLEGLVPLLIDGAKVVVPAAAAALAMWLRNRPVTHAAQQLAAQVAVHEVEADSVAMDNDEKQAAAMRIVAARLPRRLVPAPSKMAALIDGAVPQVKEALRAARSVPPAGVGPVPGDPDDEDTPTLPPSLPVDPDKVDTIPDRPSRLKPK